jgi:hypothetical protein
MDGRYPATAIRAVRWRAKTEHAKEEGRGKCFARPAPMTPAGDGLQPPAR